MSTSDQADDERRRLGAWYTPPDLAALVVKVSLRRWLDDGGDPQRVMVLDPACGSGNLLAAAAEVLQGAGLSASQSETHLVGLDVDPSAVDRARSRLPGARIEVADGLSWSPPTPVDVVVANPPFLSPLKRRTSHGAAPGRRYTDGAALFLERWAPLTRPGGRVAFVMPMSFLAAADTAGIRASLLEAMTLDSVDAQTTKVFDAAVFTCVVALVNRRSMLEDRRPTWSHRVAEQFGIEVADLPPTGPRIGDVADVRADFRDQYYGLIEAVGDGREGPRFVTSGLIGDGELRWGARPVRFAKRDFASPRVELAALSPKLQRWARRRLVPKVLVATQASRIHAVADPDGSLLPGVPVISVVPHDPADLDRVLAALRHPRATQWARCTYLGAGLTPRSIKLSARQIAELPLAWD